LVGLVALVTAGTAAALDVELADGWAVFGGVWRSSGCASPACSSRYGDRAPSLGAYLGGVAMTTAAGGALALLSRP
jgi:hypothetical protein